MSRHYSNPKRENDDHALPDVETFEAHYIYCDVCSSLVFSTEDTSGQCQDCAINTDSAVLDGAMRELTETGWFWWTCLPGCLPDSEPFGPYDTEAEALADAQDWA